MLMKALKEKNEKLLQEREEMKLMNEMRDYDPFGR